MNCATANSKSALNISIEIELNEITTVDNTICNFVDGFFGGVFVFKAQNDMLSCLSKLIIKLCHC